MFLCSLFFALALSARDEDGDAHELFNVHFVENDEHHEFTSLLQGGVSRPRRQGRFSKIVKNAELDRSKSKSASARPVKTTGWNQDIKHDGNTKFYLAGNARFKKAARSKRNGKFSFAKGSRFNRGAQSKKNALMTSQPQKDDDVVYQGPDIDLGKGECLTTGGKKPAREHRLVAKGSTIECGKRCAFSFKCAGYSVNVLGVCTLYNEVPLYPKRPSTSSARCYIRNALYSSAWPSLPLAQHNYLGCVADVAPQKSTFTGFTRPIVDKSKEKHSTASCAAHCMDRNLFVLNKLGRWCLCADDVDFSKKIKYSLDDSMCEPICDGENGLTPKRYCGDVGSYAVYGRRAPDEGDECPDSPGRHNYQSRYIFLKGDTTNLTTISESQTGSCNECAGLCTTDCHGFECTIKSISVTSRYTDVRICRLFAMPIPLSAEVKRTVSNENALHFKDADQHEHPHLGHVCARRTCDVPPSCKGKAYRLRSGFNYLGRAHDRSAKAACDVCADVCDSSVECTAYQCSDSLTLCYTYHDLATTRAPDSDFVVSDIALCLRLPNETCIITNGTLGTKNDCLCGPDTICFPGDRCDLMEIPFAKCRPPRPEPPVTCNQTSACPAPAVRNQPLETCTVANNCRECGFPPGCTDVVSRVCGSDNTTYDNRCKAECSGTLVNHTGECGIEPPTNCTEWNVDAFVVCGSDQRTYLDTCWASEANVTVGPIGVPCLPTCTSSARKDCMCGADPNFTRCPESDSCANHTCVPDCKGLLPQSDCGCTNDPDYEMCNNETSCAAVVHTSPRHDLLCVPICGLAPENRTSACACVKNQNNYHNVTARNISNVDITTANLCVGNATHCDFNTGECDRAPQCKKAGGQFCLCNKDPHNVNERSQCSTDDEYCPYAFGKPNDTCVPLCESLGATDCLCGSYTLCNHGHYCSGSGGDSSVNSTCIPYCNAGDSNCICADTHCTDAVDMNNTVVEKRYCTGASTKHCGGPSGRCPAAPPYCVPLCKVMWQTDCLCTTDPQIGDYCHDHHRCNLTAARSQCVKGTCQPECEDASGSFMVPGCPCADETYCAIGSYCLQSETSAKCLGSPLRRCEETNGLPSALQIGLLSLIPGRSLLECKCGHAVSGPVCESGEYCWEDANECISGAIKHCDVGKPCVEEACMCGSMICGTNDLCMHGECSIVVHKCPDGGIVSTACECYGVPKKSSTAQRAICVAGTTCEVTDNGEPVCTTSPKVESDKCISFCEPAKSDCVCGRNLNATCGNNTYCNSHGSLTNTTCVPVCYASPESRSSNCVCQKENDVSTLDICVSSEEHCNRRNGTCGPARPCDEAGDQFCVCGGDARHYTERSYCRASDAYCPYPYGAPNNTCVPICSALGNTDCLCGKYALCNSGTHCTGFGGGPEVDSVCVPYCGKGETDCICADIHCTRLSHGNGTVNRERFCSDVTTHVSGPPPVCVPVCEKEWETDCLCTDVPTRGDACLESHTRCSRLSNAPCTFKCEPVCEDGSGSFATQNPCPCATETFCGAGEYCFNSNSTKGCYEKPLAACNFTAEGLSDASPTALEPFGPYSGTWVPPCKCGHAEVPSICEQYEYCWETANECISGKIKECDKGGSCLNEACLCGSTPCGAGDMCIGGECNMIVEECPKRRVALKQCMCHGTKTPIKRTMCEAGFMCQSNEHHEGECVFTQPLPPPEGEKCIPHCLQAPFNFTTNCTCQGDARQERCTDGHICASNGICYPPCEETGDMNCACGANPCIGNELHCPFAFGNPNDTCLPLCNTGDSDCLCGNYTLCNNNNVNGSICSGAGGNSSAAADSTCLPYCFDAIHNRATNCGCRNEGTDQVDLCVGLEHACDNATRVCQNVNQCTSVGDQFCVCGATDCLTSDLYCPFPHGNPNDTCVPLCTDRGDTDCLCGNYTLCNDARGGSGPLVCSSAGGNASVASSCMPSCELGGTGCLCGGNEFCTNGAEDGSTSYCVSPRDQNNSRCAHLCKTGESDCLCGNYTWCSNNTSDGVTFVCSGHGGDNNVSSKCVPNCDRGDTNCFCGDSFCAETDIGARFCSEKSPTPVRRTPLTSVSIPQCLPMCTSDARTNCLCTHDPRIGDACVGEHECSMTCPGSCMNETAIVVPSCPARDRKSQACACGNATCTFWEDCVFTDRCVPKYWVDPCKTKGCVDKLCKCGTRSTAMDDDDSGQNHWCLPGDMCQDGVCTVNTPRCYEGEGECICADNEYCSSDTICIGDKDNRKCTTAPLCNVLV
eukprot:GEMP01000246.1.p1 GENE.GEMP01000246.1~~GEMP01000246.1.p1  ORF type:complete len:2245 (+),score=301.48 GEMP01000246.1:684-7418(+)